MSFAGKVANPAWMKSFDWFEVNARPLLDALRKATPVLMLEAPPESVAPVLMLEAPTPDIMEAEPLPPQAAPGPQKKPKLPPKPPQPVVDDWVLERYQEARDAGRDPPKQRSGLIPAAMVATGARWRQVERAINNKVPAELKRDKGDRDRSNDANDASK